MMHFFFKQISFTVFFSTYARLRDLIDIGTRIFMIGIIIYVFEMHVIITMSLLFVLYLSKFRVERNSE